MRQIHSVRSHHAIARSYKHDQQRAKSISSPHNLKATHRKTSWQLFKTCKCRLVFRSTAVLILTTYSDPSHFETNYDEVVESFDDMGLKGDLLRGIYSYGYVSAPAFFLH